LLILEPSKNGRFSSPLRTPAPLFNGHGNNLSTSPVHPSALRSNITSTNSTVAAALARSREASRERLDYTDLEGKYRKTSAGCLSSVFYFLVMAKVQLESMYDRLIYIDNQFLLRLTSS
jgi:hypothetical protein